MDFFPVDLLGLLLSSVHFDLPVGGGSQWDPCDSSNVAFGVSTAEDNLTALLDFAAYTAEDEADLDSLPLIINFRARLCCRR